MNTITSLVITLLCLQSHGQIHAQSLKYGFRNTPVPLNFVENGLLVKGFNKDLGQAMARQLNSPASFVGLNTMAAIEDGLITGKIDTYCIWQKELAPFPDRYSWSVQPIFSAYNLFVTRAEDQRKINSPSDLKGLRLGLLNEHLYDSIRDLVVNKQVEVVREHRAVDLISRLMKKEIDVLIGLDVTYTYLVKATGYADRLTLQPGRYDRRDFYCAFSNKSAWSMEQLNQTLENLHKENLIQQMLQAYL